MDPNQENLVAIITTEDDIHEGMIVEALEQEGVTFAVRSFDDNAFDAITESHYGHSRILVLEEDVGRATAIVDQFPSPKNE